MPQAESAPASKVIAFRPSPSGFRRENHDGDAERGRILLFTGIRYQRMDEAEAEAGADDEMRDASGDDLLL